MELLAMLYWMLLFFLILVVPGFIIFGMIYFFFLKGIKKKKLIFFVLSLLTSIMAPFNLYFIGYHSTKGWINGTAEIFIFVITSIPVIIVVTYTLFLLVNSKIEKRI
jgi:hypothetical protein